FEDPAESEPASFRALDFYSPPQEDTAAAALDATRGPGAMLSAHQQAWPAPSVLVGTPCDLWEIPGQALAVTPPTGPAAA
ncbi:hypothetical protein MNEG_5084, partial [Monoraphidium neglectum]